MLRRAAAVALAALLLPSTTPAATTPATTTTATAATVSAQTLDESGVGRWAVESSGPGSWTVSWRSPGRLPVSSDRPTIVADGVPLGVAKVASDGRTVEVTVAARTAPRPDRLDVLLSGRRLDEPAEKSIRGRVRATSSWSVPERDQLSADPGTPGDLPITTSDYELDPVDLGLPRPVEMVGHVVEPAPAAADASHPLVLFLHGRHPYCYNPATGRMGASWPCAGAQVPVPSQLGYDYVQRLLASQGFVTVSIAANAVNAQDDALADSGAQARARLIEKHLDQWAAWAGSEHQVDLDHVVLVGHSRGGEGVSRASLEIPLSAPYRIVGQVLLAPTNFTRETTPYVPTVTVLPSCDGDVSDLQGQSYTDLAKGLATGDTSMKSSVLVVGANHNFFNTEWTPGLAAAPAFDDWASSSRGACSARSQLRLSAAEQRRVGKAYVAGAVRLFADGEQEYRPMFDGSAVRLASTGDSVVLSHMIGGDRDVRTPGEGTTLTTPSGAETLLCKGVTPWGRSRKPLCGRYAGSADQAPHWPITRSLVPTRAAFQMSWEAAGGTGGLDLATPLDLTGSDWLDLRTVVDPSVGDVALQVRLTDAAGATSEVEPLRSGRLSALPAADRWSTGRSWAQDLRVETASLTGIDLAQVSRVELVGGTGRGRVWVLDLAAVRAALPTVPLERVPLVDLGHVRVVEGGDGTHVAEVPYSVTGNVPRPATFRVYGFSDAGTGPPEQHELVLAPGSGDGTFTWEYAGDELDGFRTRVVQLVGHALHDVMMRENQGRVVVRDDDPTPTMSFRAVRPRAVEGGEAVLEATLSAPSSIPSGIAWHVVRGDPAGDPLHASDVGRRWLRRWTSWEPGTDPALHRLDVGVLGWFDPGQTRLVFRVPIADDGRAEPRETLTLVATTESGWRSTPVTVVVPASG